MKTRAGCYLRISSDPNDRREGVERQRDDTTALCEIKGWTPTDYYVDNDKSASSGKARPEWDRLLADVKAGRIDAIAAWDQDRGWRMMHELEGLRKFFLTLGRIVPLATTGQGDIDLYSPTGVLAAQIKTAVSEHEIAMMKVRQRRAAKARADQGRPAWKRAFGYLDDTHQPDPVTAPLVAQAYSSILAGGSISDVAREWNAAKAFTLNGNPWTPQLVSQFLRKHRNAGLRDHLGVEVGLATWPGLVDVETWRAAQAVLNAPGRAPGRKSVRRHRLTGVMQCGADGCGGYLSGGQNAAHRRVYACKRCRGVSIAADHAEPLVFDLVTQRLARPDAVDLLKSDQDSAAAEELRAEELRLLGELDALALERAAGELTGRQVKLASDVIGEKLAAIQASQQDQDRLRVFDGLPLGTPEVGPAIAALSPDRFRNVADVIVRLTVRPIGKRGNTFTPERVRVDWL